MRSVAVVGTGLIGTSIALSLRSQGLATHLLDSDPRAVEAAVTRGAGVAGPPAGPADLAVIAVPPACIADALAEHQKLGLAHWYTDVASVKGRTRREAESAGCDLTKYVGGHPMAGSERSGPLAASAGLFRDRTWVLTPSLETDDQALESAVELVERCGARPVLMDEDDHDRAVALTSHSPHLVSSLLSARLERIDEPTARLAGQGIRDTTRIAGGDADLWTDILGSNASAVFDVLAGFAQDLSLALEALRHLSSEDEERRKYGERLLGDLLVRGVAGQARLTPGPTGALPGPTPSVPAIRRSRS